MKQDSLADAMSCLKNAEHVGKKDCVTPASKLIKSVLAVMQKRGYIGDFEYVDDGKSGKFRVMLTGKINDCAVVKPRYSVKVGDVVKWEKRFLPADGFGIVIVSTSKGMMDHDDVRAKKIGGSIVGYVY